jgi:hypothetical protein
VEEQEEEDGTYGVGESGEGQRADAFPDEGGEVKPDAPTPPSALRLHILYHRVSYLLLGEERPKLY